MLKLVLLVVMVLLPFCLRIEPGLFCAIITLLQSIRVFEVKEGEACYLLGTKKRHNSCCFAFFVTPFFAPDS